MSEHWFPPELDQCVKCGTCRTVCPVFQVSGREGDTARGKLGILGYLYRDGERFSRDTMNVLHHCVMCGSCEYACPRSVPVLQLLAAAREKAMGEGRESQAKQWVLRAISKNDTWKTLSSLSSILPSDSGLIFKLPVINRHWPVPEEDLLTTVRPYEPPIADHKFDVLFFPGCSTRFFFGDTGRKLIRILTRLGVGVWTDKRFKCCGFPHYTAGDRVTADRLQKENQAVFREYENRPRYIVTGCATCGNRLKQTAATGEEVTVLDINELLVDHLDAPSILRGSGVVPKDIVLYHDPCHLAKHQGVRQQPRQLLAPLAEVQTLSENERCCGFGGSFSLFESELSGKIGDLKARDIEQSTDSSRTSETVVVSSCPGCLMQLNDAMRRNGINGNAIHIVDILYRAMEESDELS